MLHCCVNWDGKSSSSSGKEAVILTDLQKPKNPANRLLKQYKHKSVPVVLKTSAWTTEQIKAALTRGPHKSGIEHTEFLWDEFGDMVAAADFVVLVKDVPGVRVLVRPGVVLQFDRRDRSVIDYSHLGINTESVPIAPTQSV